MNKIFDDKEVKWIPVAYALATGDISKIKDQEFTLTELGGVGMQKNGKLHKFQPADENLLLKFKFISSKEVMVRITGNDEVYLQLVLDFDEFTSLVRDERLTIKKSKINDPINQKHWKQKLQDE